MRAADVAIATIVGLSMAPLILLIGLLIVGFDGGPVLTRQNRIGRGGRRFEQYSFRIWALTRSARLQHSGHPAAEVRAVDFGETGALPQPTPVGRFIRAARLEALPAFWNVLRGDMSLVGARPTNPVQLRRYGRYRDRCLSLRPGLTGFWRLTGDTTPPLRRLIAMDLLLRRRAGLLVYLRLLIASLVLLLFREP